MEQIAVTLRPFSAQFQQATILLSIMRFAQGLLFFKHIQQEKTDESIILRGLLGSLVIGALNMRIAQMNNKPFICNSHRLTVAFLIGYITLFHYKAVPEIRQYVWRKTTPVIVLIVLCLSYSYMEENDMAKWNLCLIRTAISALLIITGLIRGSCVFADCIVSILISLSKVLNEISVLNMDMAYHNLFLLSLDLLRLYKCFAIQFHEQSYENQTADSRGMGKTPMYIFTIY